MSLREFWLKLSERRRGNMAQRWSPLGPQMIEDMPQLRNRISSREGGSSSAYIVSQMKQGTYIYIYIYIYIYMCIYISLFTNKMNIQLMRVQYSLPAAAAAHCCSDSAWTATQTAQQCRVTEAAACRDEGRCAATQAILSWASVSSKGKLKRGSNMRRNGRCLSMPTRLVMRASD